MGGATCRWKGGEGWDREKWSGLAESQKMTGRVR